MPIGFIFTTHEVEVIRKAYAGIDDSSKPEITNNLVQLAPRYGLRIIARLQNCDFGDEDQAIADRVVTRLADYLGKNFKPNYFEPIEPVQELLIDETLDLVEEVEESDPDTDE